MKKHIVIVGNGMVSYKFCERFINHPKRAHYKLTVIGEEPTPAYDRVHLSEYFTHRSTEELLMCSAEWYAENDIELLTGQLVTKIDSGQKMVTTHSGTSKTYDYLVLATGSSPFVPPIENIGLNGVYVYRTIEDLDATLAYAAQLDKSKNNKATILGGGLLGLEAAKAAIDMGLETTVVEFAPRLMPRQLDEPGANCLTSKIEDLNIKVLCSKETTHILGEDKITALQFKDGEQLPTDILIISAGIRARDELSKSAGLEKHPRGGVFVNAKMQTTDPHIYAMGEVASYQGCTYGLVAPGYEMASVVLSQIMDDEPTEMGVHIDMSTKLKLLGVDVASFGEILEEIPNSKNVVYEDKHAGIYKRLKVTEDGKTLLGGILVGDADDYNMLLQLYQNKLKLPENLGALMFKQDGSADLGSVMDLPDAAIICSCESVTKGALCGQIVDEGCDTIGQLASATKAGTGCGGCKPMVKDILKKTLESLGREVKETICVHFPFSRKELYDKILFKGVKSYDEALDTFGEGDGCETCKPALASIFAGIYNETAIKQETIQDTNDRFLANIQRNGSYSVVPRVPGGEITPDKLIVLGQVAKKYDLYSKITGGQRIDLFGARLDQLPAIWKELTDAGFESGHAYGKALRTVKSCVGSTWCRFGLDESVSFAIELENRYKGIRSPHKLKGGVSGCIRECAEARCKDFGVIATETGWNLYVCGNGGANPKHAQLLAEHIDNETVVKYIDRFLMYYIRTAPPLTRTAAWLGNLEGGMPYLIDVVVNDSLGIAEDLEKEMAGLVNSYSCEWKEVVESPELQKRFKHFVNTDDTDDNMVFVPMREQKMPKPWK